MSKLSARSSPTWTKASKANEARPDFKAFRLDRDKWRIEAISKRAADFVARNLQTSSGPGGNVLFADQQGINDLVVLLSHRGYFTKYVSNTT